MNVVNGSDGRCIVAVRLIEGVRYLERPLREVLLYTIALIITTHCVSIISMDAHTPPLCSVHYLYFVICVPGSLRL